MFSPHDPDTVLAALGDKFRAALVSSVAGARSDVEEMRLWRASWFPGMHKRTLANLIHDRLWERLVTQLQDDDSIAIFEQEQYRQIQVGYHYVLRIKRHRPANRISTYPTQTALAFYEQDHQHVLPGTELVTLAAGYLWDPTLRQIGAPVVSYREGKDNPLWAVELDEPQNGTAPIGWTPLAGPSLPVVEYGDGELADGDATGTADDS